MLGYADSEATLTPEQVTVSGVMRMTAGDKAWIAARGTGDGTSLYYNSGLGTWFCGFLISTWLLQQVINDNDYQTTPVSQ
jgi:hypothetical protein